MPKPNSFILNDETKTNSHGFRVLNSGIDLTRFLENPVMLDYHQPGNLTVIGRWENIRIEGSLLLADPVFDEEDETAKKIKSKVDRGFIKGVSMGLGIANADWKLIDNVPVLVLSELTEASIASIPSNANALKLYDVSGAIMEESDIQLSITSISNTIKNANMNKITLSVATLLVLGIQNTEDQSALSAAIDKLANDFSDMKVQLSASKKERDNLQDKLSAIDDHKATSLVDEAVKTGKITADKKEYFLSLAKSDFATCEGILSSMQPKNDLAGNVVHPSGATAFDNIKSMDDFEKLSHDQKLSFKAERPEDYKQIFQV